MATTTGRSAGSDATRSTITSSARHAGRRELDAEVAPPDRQLGDVGAVEHDADVGAVAGRELVEGVEQARSLVGQGSSGQPSLATL